MDLLAPGNALVNCFQFVADHQRRYGVKQPCTTLGIARSSFHYWRKTAAMRAARFRDRISRPRSGRQRM
ncbi:hypothetical protein [Streptomyces sp. NPDC058268]|uniref:hypothetical protein n=1 Tax=Streptomyces sp. NPDC058268 TaxID=3346413 RepID=UPI0036E6F340